MTKPSQNYLKRIYKDPTHFKIQKKITNNGHFSHHVFLAKKFKNGQQKSLWFAKDLGGDRTETLAELLAQEISRLILSQQPKTRRLIKITKNKIQYFVLSKEIPHFDEKFFSTPHNQKLIVNNTITGLAATQILALWLNEIDFKPGNVGVDHDKKAVVKLDGGLSFILLNPNYAYLHNRNFEISSVDLEALPNLISYEACNWLQHILWHNKGYAFKKEPTSFDKRLNGNPLFKAELYRTILRIISLPNELIQFFTKNYICNPEDVKKFSNFLIVRKEQLAVAAQKIPAFNDYRQSHQARKEMFEFLHYLKNFKTMEKSNLLNAFEKKYTINAEKLIWKRFLNNDSLLKTSFQMS